MRSRSLVTPSRSSIILIQAHNEQATVGEVVRRIRQTGNWPVAVIDDCSTDQTATVARAAGAIVLPLPIQLGAWGATQTGLRYALACGYPTAITLDADGQHDPSSIPDLLAPLAAGWADVVIGAFPERASRNLRWAWAYFRLLTGLRIEDITSGFRAYGAAAISILASREASLLDYQDVGVLLILRRKGLRLAEAPVAMNPRTTGRSRIFYSWWAVSRFLLQTSVLGIARIGFTHPLAHTDDPD